MSLLRRVSVLKECFWGLLITDDMVSNCPAALIGDPMKKIAFVFAVTASNLLVQPALADSAAKSVPASAAALPAFSTDETTIGDLLDNTATNEVLKKYLPEIVSSDQIELARNMTLRQIQQYAPDEVTDAKLAEVDKALAELKK